ncbi:hypothetical protein BD769DRAFT_1747190 [Suillus cothurnatus]|nr:hypothetical protein BD769DRAFT_1747190 [Suillus cothurnatus]
MTTKKKEIQGRWKLGMPKLWVVAYCIRINAHWENNSRLIHGSIGKGIQVDRWHWVYRHSTSKMTWATSAIAIRHLHFHPRAQQGGLSVQVVCFTHTVTEGRQLSLFEGIPTAHPTLRRYTRPTTVVAVKIQVWQTNSSTNEPFWHYQQKLTGKEMYSLVGKLFTVIYVQNFRASGFNIIHFRVTCPPIEHGICEESQTKMGLPKAGAWKL